MQHRVVWGTLGVLVLVGMGFTLRDYLQWRREETKNYGQKSLETAQFQPAGELVGPYENRIAKLRIKYPATWTVRENKTGEEIVSFSDPDGRAKLSVGTKQVTQNLSDLAKKEAVGSTKDWEYFNAGGESWVILTWEGERQIVQKVLSKKGNKLWVMEFTCERDVWPVYALTLGQVYRSVTLL